jgi:hypothetical protein
VPYEFVLLFGFSFLLIDLVSRGASFGDAISCPAIVALLFLAVPLIWLFCDFAVAKWQTLDKPNQ